MPGNPMLSASGDPASPLHSSGHGCFVETPAGEWYFAHLCRRPIVNGRSVLGRETAIQKIAWDSDGWPRLDQGGVLPAVEVPDPGLGSKVFPVTPARDDFDKPNLAVDWQSLRLPFDEAHGSLTERPGYLRLKGHESLLSLHDQIVVARRQRAFHIQATTVVEFQPENFQQSAGLVAFYNTGNFFYLFVSRADYGPLAVGLMTCDRSKVAYPIETVVDAGSSGRVYLRVEIDLARLRFFYSTDGDEWVPIGDEQDASTLSDEYALPWAFTGNFVGMACQDLTGSGKAADFDWFEYREL
jgi:xylan 1,4-beta-xylosidase